ncbi:GNAT family N-acetyltransferase [Streptomyces sp. NBC_01264]|uniref:GNAT family N-acetyltransferase n=1 Tax=Streptomyces sp. NBC_01264 TaxID=2903804 RepID=UPI00225164A2|nr:GNAT family N-acetyltransferase [Streptomyces sp. NBC_01264]MCX4783829.1 GNAT family N-acetyltransferase [Streptomyces sp. NBC_01264]
MSGHWVRLELTVRTFHSARFTPYVDRCRAAGFSFTTLARLGDAEDERRSLYELNKECSAGIPEQGVFHSYDAYTRLRFAVPSYDPAGIIVARDQDGTWVGMAATSLHLSDGFAFNEMTGVRGRGISLAMKTLGIAFADEHGAPVIRTIHHPANTSAIAMNRTLGYMDANWHQETP